MKVELCSKMWRSVALGFPSSVTVIVRVCAVGVLLLLSFSKLQAQIPIPTPHPVNPAPPGYHWALANPANGVWSQQILVPNQQAAQRAAGQQQAAQQAADQQQAAQQAAQEAQRQTESHGYLSQAFSALKDGDWDNANLYLNEAQDKYLSDSSLKCPDDFDQDLQQVSQIQNFLLAGQAAFNAGNYANAEKYYNEAWGVARQSTLEFDADSILNPLNQARARLEQKQLQKQLTSNRNENTPVTQDKSQIDQPGALMDDHSGPMQLKEASPSAGELKSDSPPASPTLTAWAQSPDIESSPAAAIADRGWSDLQGRDWPSAWAVYQTAVNHDPGNAALQRMADFAKWLKETQPDPYANHFSGGGIGVSQPSTPTLDELFNKWQHIQKLEDDSLINAVLPGDVPPVGDGR